MADRKPLLPIAHWRLRAREGYLLAGIHDSPPGRVYYVKVPWGFLPHGFAGMTNG